MDSTNVNTSSYFLETGPLNVSLTGDGKWKRRYLSLIGETLYVFPRESSEMASARVKLTHVHDVQGTDLQLTFILMKKSRVTLYIQVRISMSRGKSW